MILPDPPMVVDVPQSLPTTQSAMVNALLASLAADVLLGVTVDQTPLEPVVLPANQAYAYIVLDDVATSTQQSAALAVLASFAPVSPLHSPTKPQTKAKPKRKK